MPSPSTGRTAELESADEKRPVRALVDWLFRSRVTGKITIAQVPNIPLAVFLAASALRLILRPSGPSGTALKVMATGALLWWAVDEVIRGVNPWRRLLGGGVLLGQVILLILG